MTKVGFIALISFECLKIWCPLYLHRVIFYFDFILGNLEIGNGYGVPGGGAYYGAPVLGGKNISTF